MTAEILRHAPHPPRVSAHTSTSIIEEVHAAAHDPNATLLIATDDADREEKANGIPKGFLAGRQKALDQYALLFVSYWRGTDDVDMRLLRPRSSRRS